MDKEQEKKLDKAIAKMQGLVKCEGCKEDPSRIPMYEPLSRPQDGRIHAARGFWMKIFADASHPNQGAFYKKLYKSFLPAASDFVMKNILDASQPNHTVSIPDVYKSFLADRPSIRCVAGRCDGCWQMRRWWQMGTDRAHAAEPRETHWMHGDMVMYGREGIGY